MEGCVSQVWPVSVLQLHKNAVIVCDEAAAEELRFKTVKYFMEMENSGAEASFNWFSDLLSLQPYKSASLEIYIQLDFSAEPDFSIGLFEIYGAGKFLLVPGYKLCFFKACRN